MPVPAAAERHPHLAAALDEGWVRVDMHMHSMWSGDATTTPDELEEAVVATGLDVLCLTDHGTINGAAPLDATLPCRLIVGEEVRTHEGELIGLFLTERLPFGMRARDAAGAIRDQGGVVYVPHPFDPMRHCLQEETLVELADSGLIHAIEVFNAKVSLHHLNQRAQDFARDRGLLAGAGSDAHEPTALGAAYVEVPDFVDAPSFLDALRRGRVVGHAYDQPRRWRPRVVPSTKAL